MALDITGEFLPGPARVIVNKVADKVFPGGQKAARDPAVDLVFAQVSAAVQRLGSEVEQNGRVDASTRAAAATLRKEWQSVTEDWQAGELDINEITAFSSRVNDVLARAAMAQRPRLQFSGARNKMLVAAGVGLVGVGVLGTLTVKAFK